MCVSGCDSILDTYDKIILSCPELYDGVKGINMSWCFTKGMVFTTTSTPVASAPSGGSLEQGQEGNKTQTSSVTVSGTDIWEGGMYKEMGSNEITGTGLSRARIAILLLLLDTGFIV